ncbi:Gag-Pol polyprotein [Gossypium australe]|uniref:Gag-Pol polyprotein n=1 Tax=Gossypium australe TaxID=47621 RepID=A0A5B6UYB1_9ROSI|nr:Gag-Pol polyprotein [Gossypium australe]
MDSGRAVADDVESNAPAPVQGTTLVTSRPHKSSQEGEAKVSDEMSLTPDECIKCVVSLLRDTAYNWWKTLISVVPRERVIRDFFQKRKEFLELKRGHMTVTEYEREFVRLSQYARECVSAKATMCKHFIEGLNEDIKLLVRILDINEFVVLVERAYKTDELSKEKKKVDSEARDERKRSMIKLSQPSMKRFRDEAVQMLRLDIRIEIVQDKVLV